MNDLISTKIKFLRDHGAHLCKHSGKTLLEHLENTRDILRKEGAPEYLQDAGLFHSVYGTTYFKPKITVDRDAVRELIGNHAEALAAIFCFMPHPRLDGITSER